VLLSGVINPHLLPAKWQKAAQRLGRTGSTGALLLGCAFGLLQTPACPTCGNAVQALVQTAGERSSFGGILLFAGFAAGQGLMMLAVGVLTSLIVPELLRRLRTKMCSIEQRIQLLAGNVLMILGIYFIIVG
jgi:cytochrome c biogenesis protein CcdA